MQNIFKTKQGDIVVAQWPNTPLWIAVVLYLVGLYPNQDLQLFSKVNMIPVLLYWSYLEIFKGDNTFRRILGLVVAVFTLRNALILLEIL